MNVACQRILRMTVCISAGCVCVCVWAHVLCVYASEDICAESVFSFCFYEFQGSNSIAKIVGHDPQSHLACPRSIFKKYPLLVESIDTELLGGEVQLCLQIQARVTVTTF